MRRSWIVLRYCIAYSLLHLGRNFTKNDGITQFIAATILTTEKLLENEEVQVILSNIAARISCDLVRLIGQGKSRDVREVPEDDKAELFRIAINSSYVAVASLVILLT